MELTPPFSLETSRIGAHDVIVIKGEVDLASAPRLDNALSKFKRHEVFVDLRKTEFMDSAGLRVLIAHNARIGEQGGTLRLLLGEGPVLRLLELAGVRDSFSIRPTIDSPDA
ncbi:MAG TPA: STAS domain-containing protein [Acidimicrobiia bacterium]|nr:STAS domain-containing protein [Acidimicrobiia bacterium]